MLPESAKNLGVPKMFLKSTLDKIPHQVTDAAEGFRIREVEVEQVVHRLPGGQLTPLDRNQVHFLTPHMKADAWRQRSKLGPY